LTFKLTLNPCSHSIGEILDLLKAKSAVFQDVKRRTDSLYRHPRGNRGQILNDRWDSDTYSIFSEYTEKKFFDFDDDIMKSPAYRRVYSSIRSVQRPRRPQRTRLEPIVNLLDEEDLIDLRDNPPLIPSYTLELENELSPSSLDRRLSTQPSTTSPNIIEDTINEYLIPIKSQSNQDCEPNLAFSKANALEVPERLTNTDNPTEDMESQGTAGSPDKEEVGGAALDSADGLISTDGDGIKIIETGLDETKLEETKSNEPISDKTIDDAVLVDGNVETTDAMKISKPLINTSPPIAVGDTNPAPRSELTRPAMPSAISQQTTATYALEPINLPGNSDSLIEAAASGKSDSVRERLVKTVQIRDAVLQLALLSASLHGHTDIVDMLLLRGINVNCSQSEKVMICERSRTNLTPLHLAAANNKSSTIELLLKCGAEVGSKDSLGWTPLHFASARGCVSAVQVLLEHKAPIESGESGASCTPLFVATSFGALETAMVLRDSGANQNVKAKFGFTLLHAAALGNCTDYSTTFKERLIFSEMVDLFRPINRISLFRPNRIPLFRPNSIHHIQLLSGSKLQSLSRIAHLEHLIEIGCDPSTPDAFGFTPLHLACLHSIDIARVLIKHTKNISAKSKFGWTPLHIAALWSSDVLLAQLLIQAGADLEVPLGQPGVGEAGGEIWASQRLAELNDPFVTSLTPLGLAVAKSNHDMAKYLLRMGAKSQMPGPSGIGVLYIAAAMGNTAILVLLCKQGVGFRQKGLQGIKTAERSAAEQSPDSRTSSGQVVRIEKREQLVASTSAQSTEEFFASEECLPKSLRMDVDTCDRHGNTPLLRVIRDLNVAATRSAAATRLLELGANPGVSEQDGKYLLHFSAKLEVDEIRQLFKAGAPLDAKGPSGFTPLLELVRFGSNPRKLECLVSLGADIYAKDAKGRSAWKLVSERYKSGIGHRAISSISSMSLSELTDNICKSEIKKSLNKARKMKPPPRGWVK
jgi:ankyrin repeat protein